MSRLAVILPAGGSSTRFGANKLSAELCGRSVFERTLDVFLTRTDVAQIVVPSATPDLLDKHDDPRVSDCLGGRCRAESVRNALPCVRDDLDWVAVHDAARPLVTNALIDRVFSAAREHGAAAPALPVSSTIKQTTATSIPARAERTIPRQNLWAMQTPQIMQREALLDAFARCPIALEEVTDDAQLLELAGQAVWLVEGEEQNLKITTPLDLLTAQAILNAQ
jgi:2-C-methyl-D-erythritol 4-phosphate cytidylyltransferase